MIGHNRKTRSINTLTSIEKEKLKKAILELDNSLTRIAAEKEHQKDIVDTLSDDLGLEKKLIRNLGKTYFKANFKEVSEEHKEFADFYELIMNIGTS